MDLKTKRVLMAMSGGVDSSVAALTLVEAGYDVSGVTMKLFNNEDVGFNNERAGFDDEDVGFNNERAGFDDEKTCCSLKDAEDARQVCLSLGIEHFVYNFTRTFNEDVIERFCDSYLRGETPNPCIDCNRYLKFAALQQRRRELGFDYVATGHYARRTYNEKTGRYELKRGLDANKDQSYVLFHLDQDTLAHMLFPLGDLDKPQVRELAARHGFINADKSESQDICFIPDGNYARFIEMHEQARSVEPGDTHGEFSATRPGNACGKPSATRPGNACGKPSATTPGNACGEFSATTPGVIELRDGTAVGEHTGLIHYTIGQRKGIGVAYREPLYVFAKDAARNVLVVDTNANTMCAGIEVREANFIARASIEEPLHLAVKAHYRQTARPATVQQIADDRLRITFDTPQRACAPGQAAVVYDGDTVVCGGTIDASF